MRFHEFETGFDQFLLFRLDLHLILSRFLQALIRIQVVLCSLNLIDCITISYYFRYILNSCQREFSLEVGIFSMYAERPLFRISH